MSYSLTVRARITLWNVAVVALVLVLAGVAVRYLLQASLMSGVEKDLRGFGEMAARRSATFPLRKPSDKPRSAAPPSKPREDFIPRSGPDLRPRVLDRLGQDHRPDETVGPWDAGAFERALEGERVLTKITSEGERLLVYSVPAVKDEQIQGVIQVVAPLNPAAEAIGRLTNILLILVPAGLLLAALGGAFLTGRALRPVAEIAEAAGEIQAERLSARLPVRGNDEFARLTGVLNSMLERLDSAFERQCRFTGDASHELRTPLATIKATSSLARDDQWDAPDCHAALGEIEEAANRAQRIVDDLLLLARADSKTLAKRTVEPSSLSDVVRYAVEAVEQSHESHGPHATILVGQSVREELRVAADAGQLARVFVNLLENALRHTPAQGHVFIEAVAEDDAIRVSVRDTGEGIAPEHLPHLTERFYRVDASRTRDEGGAGLGLAICRGIVAAYGGRMTIQSELSRGTEVILNLPRSGPRIRTLSQ